MGPETKKNLKQMEVYTCLAVSIISALCWFVKSLGALVLLSHAVTRCTPIYCICVLYVETNPLRKIFT